MSLYIIFAILAYLLFALNGIADKFLLTNVIRKPVVYAFYIGVASALVIVLAPFGLRMLSLPYLLIAFLAGAIFTYALYFFYSAIQEASVSRVLPIEGGLVPIFTLLASFIILGEQFGTMQLLSFALLVLGSVLISFKKTEGKWKSHALKNAVIAAIFFALGLTLMKYVYLQTNFVSGMIWTRIGLLLGALTFLLHQDSRRAIFSAPKDTGRKNIFLFYGSHIMGTLGALLQNYAIAIGSVAIVSALQGVQFVFLLILSVIFSLYFPKIIREDITGRILVQKIIAIILIAGGLILLGL